MSAEGQIIDFFRINPMCGRPEMAETVPHILSGTNIEGHLPISFCSMMHVESGSGPSDIGKVSFISCKYSFEIGPLPKN